MADPTLFPYQHATEFFHSIEQNDASITEVTLVSGHTREADAEALRLGEALVKNIENSSPSHITSLRIENHLLFNNEALVSHIDAYLGPLLYFLRHSPSLRIVTLRHVRTAWAVLLQAVSDNPHVRHVSVQGLSFDDAIAWDIRHVETLRLMAFDGAIGNSVLSTATDRLQTLVLHSHAEDPEPIFLEALQHGLPHLRSLSLKSSHTMVPAAATGRILRQIATCVPNLQDLALEYFCIKALATIQAPCLSLTKCAVGSALPKTVRSLTLNMVRVMEEEEDDGTENGTAAGNEGGMNEAEDGPTNNNDTPQHNCITRFLANTTTAAGEQTTTLEELHWDMQPWGYRPVECQHLFLSTLPRLTALRKLRVHYLDANEAVVLARQLPGLRHLQALVVERISLEDIHESAVPAAFANGLYENGSLLEVEVWRRRTVPLLSLRWVERCCAQRNRYLPTLLLRNSSDHHAITPLFPSLVQTAFETPATGISMVVASLLQWE